MFVFLWLLSLLAFSCKQQRMNINSLKNGTFKTVLDDSDMSSTAVRYDTVQIESYNNQLDTFKIYWKNDFEYVLTKTHPKTLLDSTPFHVKIIEIKQTSYSFIASYKGSNFKQKGKAFKLEK
jgi:hypothetical protein